MSQGLPWLLFRPTPSVLPTTQEAFNALDGTLRFINVEDLRYLVLRHLVSYQSEELPPTHVQLSRQATLQETFDAYQVVYWYITRQIDALPFSETNIELAHRIDTLLCLMNAHIRSRYDAGDFYIHYQPLPRYDIFDQRLFVPLGHTDRDALDGAFRYIMNTELRSRIIELYYPWRSPLERTSFLRTMAFDYVMFRLACKNLILVHEIMTHVDMSYDTLTGPNAPSEKLRTYLNLRKYCIGSEIPVTFIPTNHNVFRALPAFFRFIVDTEVRGQTINCVRQLGFPERNKPLRFRDLPSAHSLTRAQATDAFYTVRAYLKRRNPDLWEKVKKSKWKRPGRTNTVVARTGNRESRPRTPAQTNAGVVNHGIQARIPFAHGQALSPDIVLPYCVLEMQQRVLFIAEDIFFEGPDAPAIRLALSLGHLWHGGSEQQLIIRRSTTNVVYHRIGGTWVTIGNTGTCQDRGYETEAQECESERINIERLRWAREQTSDTNRPPNDDHGTNNEPAITEDHERALLYPWWFIPPETRVYSERRLRTYNRPQTITFLLTECVRRYLHRVNNDASHQADGHAASDSTPNPPWIRAIAQSVATADRSQRIRRVELVLSLLQL
ncbi:hypothetical protein BDV97DRAFT_372300 [Delphinella strobiligena]|nr:hypothetical protein BDV97DRAFT_372300 [Delphinella strobiligena]